MKYIVLIILAIVFVSNLMGQELSDKGLEVISVSTVEAPVKFLASDYTEGREVGTKGAYLAAEYIASIFQMVGIKPLGDMDEYRLSREFGLKGIKKTSYRSYFQNFDLLTGPRKAESELHLITKTNFSSQQQKSIEGVDYQLNGNFGTMEMEAPIVFLGYGIKSKALKSDPFGQLDVKGKVVFLLSKFPGSNDPTSQNYTSLKKDTLFSFKEFENEKIEQAYKAGALAVLRYHPDRELKSANPSNLPMFHDNEFYEGDKVQDDFYLKKINLPYGEDDGINNKMPIVDIGKNLVESFMSESGNLLFSMLQPDYNMSSFKAFEIRDARFSIKIKRDQQVIRARNVLGYIEGENPDEVIVIGAHYDHVGKYNGFIFNGADDNASGTAGMITLARAFKESGKKPKKTIVFAAWTAEEQGLWGSKYFVKNIPDKLNVILNVNLDMISRTSIKDSSDSYLSMQYTKGFETFEHLFKEHNKTYKLGLDIRYFPHEQPKGGSDFAPFAKVGIPVISLFTGLHKDYHMPNDEIEFIDLPKMVNIIKLTYLGINDILENNKTSKK